MLTYTDFQDAKDTGTAESFIVTAIDGYKSSPFYRSAMEADAYFRGENIEIANRPKWTMKKSGKTVYFSKNIAVSNFFFRFVVQQNQFLLANGLQTKSQSLKDRLGMSFDKALEAIGEKSLVHGKCYGFWNQDHLEKIDAVSNGGLSGCFVLLDERTSAPMVGIHFWQLDADKQMNIRLFEADGITEYVKRDSDIAVAVPKTPYRSLDRSDLYAGKRPPSDFSPDYGALPLIPLYANEYGVTEFTRSIKTKIDLYDKIFSDFGDNLERTNDIYWVVNNFGGNAQEAKDLLAEIEELRAIFSEDAATATPHTIEVPYAARQIALSLLEKALYADYMAMNMNEITGGSLTNVAIDTAKLNLTLKVNRFEWMVFQFVQQLLKLVGADTEDIKFRRQLVANESETIANVISEFDAGLLDLQTALEKLPNVEIDEVPVIMKRLDTEKQSKADEEFPMGSDEEDDDAPDDETDVS